MLLNTGRFVFPCKGGGGAGGGTSGFDDFLMIAQDQTITAGSLITGGNRTFDWVFTDLPNVVANSVEITDVTNPAVLGTALSETPTATLDIGVDKTGVTNDVYTWQITATDTLGATLVETFSVTWSNTIYWGNTANGGVLTEAEILGLVSSDLRENYKSVYDCPATGYKVIAIPTSLVGTDTIVFRDASTGFKVLGENPVQTISVTNGFGHAEQYSLYRTFYEMGGAVDIIISDS